MTRDRISALISIIIGTVFLPFALKVRQNTAFANKNDPGSRFMPIIACAVLIVAGIGLLLSAPKEQKRFFTNKQWKDLLIGLGCAILYVFVMNFTGFLSATTVFLFVMCTLFLHGKKMALWKRIVYAVIVSGGIYFLFTNILGMRLPTGFLI